MSNDTQKWVPESLAHWILPFNWQVQRVRSVESEVTEVALNSLLDLLDQPIWSSQPNVGMLFDLTPKSVLTAMKMRSSSWPHQQHRINNADLAYPLDYLFWRDRLWILDGSHRLAKHYLAGSMTVMIRIHPETIIEQIKQN